MRLKVVYSASDAKKIKDALKPSIAVTETEEQEGDEFQLVLFYYLYVLLFGCLTVLIDVLDRSWSV